MARTDELRQRLGALVRDRSGAARIEDASPSDWAARIASLRDAQRVRESQRRSAERTLPGEEIARGVRLIRSIEPWSSVGLASTSACHSRDQTLRSLPGAVRDPVALHEALDPGLRRDGDKEPPWEPAGTRIGPLVFLDTETTGLSGGTGTLVFLLGLARFEGASLVVEQWLLTQPSGEQRWLEAIARSLPADATLVSFNGKSFDLPLLATRHALNRRSNPFADRPHWDLLFPLRRAFDSRWPDCRLQTAERRLLGIARCDDLPGAFAPAAYQGFLRNGECGLLHRVLAHNRQDLVSLAHLIPALARVSADPLAFDADAAAIGRSLARCGDLAGAERLLEIAALRQPNARRVLADLKRKQRHWEDAEKHWRVLATDGCPRACEALAKLAEHIRAAPAEALAWALRMESVEPALPGHAVRIARLRRKLGFSGPERLC